MTKLYHAAEGWQIPGQQDKGATRVDVPNPPDQLADWLNARLVSPEMRAAVGDPELLEQIKAEHPPCEQFASSAEDVEARRMAMGRCPRCNGTPRGAELLLKGEEKDAIVEWVEQATELWMLEPIALAIKERVAGIAAALEAGGTIQ